MTYDIFKPLDYCAYIRATNVMSTESTTDYEWSVKVAGSAKIYVGIVSELSVPRDSDIYYGDQNAIIYSHRTSSIIMGPKTIHSKLKHKTGDIIRFRFQSDIKKLLIDLVRN